MEQQVFIRKLIEIFLNYLLQQKLLSENNLKECLQEENFTPTTFLERLVIKNFLAEKSIVCSLEEVNQKLLKNSPLFSLSLPDKNLYGNKTESSQEKRETTVLPETLANEEVTSNRNFLSKEATPPQNLTLSNDTLEIDSFLNSQTQLEQKNSSFIQTSRYTVLKSLGEGGMGVVELAKDKLLGREVALKKIKTPDFEFDTLSNKQQIRLWRLKQEASLTAILEHPNIVPLYDMEKKINGELYFTMRKIEGENLRELIHRKMVYEEEFEEGKILSIFAKICEAISYAHNKGIIHRDLKPDNIMVGEFGEVYVMDWGIAKKVDEEQEEEIDEVEKNALFQTMGAIGTPGYMSPEQRRSGSQLTVQSDIYALGKILRECFIGHSPVKEFKLILEYYQDNSRKGEEVSKGQAENEMDSKLPPDILAIVNKATQENLQDRYQTVTELLKDLENYQNNFRISAREYTTFEIFKKWLVRNKQKAIFFSIICFLFVAFPAFFQWKKNQRLKKNFQEAFQLAQKQTKDLKSFKVDNKQQESEKLKFLFHALNTIDTALSLQPKHFQAEATKFKIGNALVDLSCQTHNFQLANYIANEINALISIPRKARSNLLQKVRTVRFHQLRENQTHLNYWIERFKKKQQVAGDLADALFEVSRMQEVEIFDQLMSHLKEGNQYFLEEKNQTEALNGFYEFIAMVLGRIKNTEASKPMKEALSLFGKKLSVLPQGKRSRTQVSYMVALTEAYGRIKSVEHIDFIYLLREEMGADSYYTTQTNRFFLRMAQFVSLKKGLKTTQEYVTRGLMRFAQKNFMGALSDFNTALKMDPKNIPAYTNRGNVKKELKQYQEAVDDYTKAITLNLEEEGEYFKDLAGIYSNRGNVLKKLGLVEEAFQDYNETIRLAPKNAKVYLNRGNFKYDLKDYKGAIEDFTRAIAHNPYLSEAYVGRGLAKRNLKDFKGAIKDLSEVLRFDPQNATAYNTRGNLMKLMGKIGEALADFDEAIRLAPQYADVYINRGNLRIDIGDYKGAVQDYNEAIRLNPKLPESYINRGIARLKQNSPKETIADFNIAIKLDPKNPSYYLKRGKFKWVLEDYKGSIEDCGKALQLDSKLTEAYFTRGSAYYELKQFGEATVDLLQGMSFHYDVKYSRLLAELLLNRMMQNFQQKKFLKVKEDIQLFEKFAPPNHPRRKVIPDMRKLVEKELKKEKK